MNRPKSDRWPAYNPTRHVLIERDFRNDRPWQGFVVDWKRHGYKWSALVVFIDESVDGMPLVQQWLPIEKLRPMQTDPNPPRDEWF